MQHSSLKEGSEILKKNLFLGESTFNDNWRRNLCMYKDVQLYAACECEIASLFYVLIPLRIVCWLNNAVFALLTVPCAQETSFSFLFTLRHLPARWRTNWFLSALDFLLLWRAHSTYTTLYEQQTLKKGLWSLQRPRKKEWRSRRIRMLFALALAHHPRINSERIDFGCEGRKKNHRYIIRKGRCFYVERHRLQRASI